MVRFAIIAGPAMSNTCRLVMAGLLNPGECNGLLARLAGPQCVALVRRISASVRTRA
ncbi:putative exported protein of unknown function [Bradyrhizobium sp. BTAi1]|nr:putative exported protein of unknown function [Bradyrhizobium sp. BTAi1]